MRDDTRRIRQAAARAVIDKLNEGAPHDEVAKAGEDAADAEFRQIIAMRRWKAKTEFYTQMGTTVLAAVLVAVVLIGLLL